MMCVCARVYQYSPTNETVIQISKKKRQNIWVNMSTWNIVSLAAFHKSPSDQRHRWVEMSALKPTPRIQLSPCLRVYMCESAYKERKWVSMEVHVCLICARFVWMHVGTHAWINIPLNMLISFVTHTFFRPTKDRMYMKATDHQQHHRRRRLSKRWYHCPLLPCFTIVMCYYFSTFLRQYCRAITAPSS